MAGSPCPLQSIALAAGLECLHPPLPTLQQTSFPTSTSRLFSAEISLRWASILSLPQDYVGLRGVFAVGCAVLTLPVFALLAFTFVPPLVATIWLGITYSFAAVSKKCGLVYFHLPTRSF